jgi:DNA-binding NarL/FixJ family response regulator
MMTEALLVLVLLGVVWAVTSTLILFQRVRAAERLLHQERQETAARLEALEILARDRWLAEGVTLGEQVTAMIEALEQAALQSRLAIAGHQAEVASVLEQSEQRLEELRAVLAAPAPGVPGRKVPHSDERQPPAAVPPARCYPATDDGVAALPSRYREIRRMAADGLAPAEIARRTGLSVAGIQLILRLRDPEVLQQSA